MKSTRWKTLSLNLLYVLMFIIGSAMLTYFTADGTAVIGPNPASVEAQRADIVLSTLWAALVVGSVSIFSLIMANRPARHSSVSR